MHAKVARAQLRNRPDRGRKPIPLERLIVKDAMPPERRETYRPKSLAVAPGDKCRPKRFVRVGEHAPGVVAPPVVAHFDPEHAVA